MTDDDKSQRRDRVTERIKALLAEVYPDTPDIPVIALWLPDGTGPGSQMQIVGQNVHSLMVMGMLLEAAKTVHEQILREIQPMEQKP